MSAVMGMGKITVKAPINIALIKYWGKSDEDKMIPCNDSISMTIDSPELITITTVEIDEQLEEDQFELNGQPEVILNKRIKATINQVCIFKIIFIINNGLIYRREKWHN